jgi:hypothetical protein
MYLNIFHSFFGFLCSGCIPLWDERIEEVISLSFVCYSLLYVLKYHLFWRMFHGPLRRMYIVLLLDEVFSRYLLSSFGLQFHLILTVFVLFWLFCLFG